MVEPSSRTLEYAWQIIKYDRSQNPLQITIFGHDFLYQTERQASEAADALYVKFALFLESFWLENQIISWDAAASIKGQA